MSDAQTRLGRRCVLWLGMLVIIGAAAFWQPLQRATLAYVLLHSEAPADEVFSNLIDASSRPRLMLERLWASQRIAHRQFVLRYLGRTCSSNPGLFREMSSLLFAATRDVDLDSRQLAFAVLATAKHPQLRRLAREQLTDADPGVRLLGLQQLRVIGSSNDVAICMRMLEDPEPRVVVAAAQVLRRATGQHFGIKSAHAMPQFTVLGPNPPPAPDLPAISQGVRQWQEWWREHQSDYPAPQPPLPPAQSGPSLPTADFVLSDLTGKPHHLSDFRGKVVLLAFWSLDLPASLDIATYRTLQAHLQELEILAICIPPIPSCAAEHEDGQHKGHAHAHQNELAPTPQNVSTLVGETGPAPFLILIDAQGRIGFRFKADERPTCVLLDRQGRIGRRFEGVRATAALERMITELRDRNETR